MIQRLGAGFVKFKALFEGAIMRLLPDRLSDRVSVLDFGADPTGVRDSSDAFQRAVNCGKTVLVPIGIYRIDKEIVVQRSVTIVGEGNNEINRAKSFINMQGNFPFIRNWQVSGDKNSMIQFHAKRLFIQYNPAVRPEVDEWQVHGNKTAFLFESTDPGKLGLELSSFEDITVVGAWQFMYDSTGTYMTKMSRCEARDCRIGFRKSTGTTYILENCFTNRCRLAYSFGAMAAVKMVGCGMDNTDVSVAKSGENIMTGIQMSGVRSFSIDTFDAEVSRVSTDGGGIASLVNIEDSVGSITGFIGLRNTLVTEGAGDGGSVAMFHLTNNSLVRFADCETEFWRGEAPPYQGNGYGLTVLADATSKAYMENCRMSAPVKKAGTTGTPALLALSQGDVTWGFNCKTTGLIVSGGTKVGASGGALIADSFVTLKGKTAVTASVSTAAFDVPERGSYLVSVYAEGSGVNYSASANIIYDGSGSAVHNMYTGAFTKIDVSGRTVGFTCQGTTTLTWSCVRIL